MTNLFSFFLFFFYSSRYANAITVGKNEARRAKKIARQYIHREEKHVLFGRSLDRMIKDTNESMVSKDSAATVAVIIVETVFYSCISLVLSSLLSQLSNKTA